MTITINCEEYDDDACYDAPDWVGVTITASKSVAPGGFVHLRISHHNTKSCTILRLSPEEVTELSRAMKLVTE